MPAHVVPTGPAPYTADRSAPRIADGVLVKLLTSKSLDVDSFRLTGQVGLHFGWSLGDFGGKVPASMRSSAMHRGGLYRPLPWW